MAIPIQMALKLGVQVCLKMNFTELFSSNAFHNSELRRRLAKLRGGGGWLSHSFPPCNPHRGSN
jgi:hypothetical protein